MNNFFQMKLHSKGLENGALEGLVEGRGCTGESMTTPPGTSLGNGHNSIQHHKKMGMDGLIAAIMHFPETLTQSRCGKQHID